MPPKVSAEAAAEWYPDDNLWESPVLARPSAIVWRENVRKEMKERGISQKELAASIGRDAPTIGRVLAGTRKITPEINDAICRAWGFPVHELFVDKQDPRNVIVDSDSLPDEMKREVRRLIRLELLQAKKADTED